MLRLLALLTATLALPAAAQIQKCAGPNGTTIYSDKGCTQRDARTSTAEASGHAGTAPVDAPLEAVETGIPVITQLPGRFAWLDDQTLAVTTFADPSAKAPWMVRRIVAWDAATRTSRTLVPRGFIDCVNAGHRLVGLELGDLESRFAVGARGVPAVQQFQLWDPAARTLAPAPSDVAAAWHPAACLKPAPEDLGVRDLLGSKKPLRYLQPEHGMLAWGALDDSGHPSPPALLTPKKKIALAVSINDVSHDVRWLAFRQAYQLAPGAHDRSLAPPRDAALVTMDLNGRVTRREIPAALVRQLDSLGAPAPAEMIATGAGDLVLQPGPAARGGGLYLVQGEQSRRVWCTAAPGPGQAGGADACASTQPPALSPNGCRLAFDARPAGTVVNGFPGAPTIKVITLCDELTAAGGAPAAGPHHKPR